MSLKNSTSSYGSVSKFFHWLIFFLLLIIVPMGYFMFDIPDKPLRSEVINIHKLIGLFILAVVILRLLWALINVKPVLPFGTPTWQRWAERSVHFLLYAILLAMPISGWVGSVSGGYVPHLGNVKFGLPIAENKTLSDFLFDNVHVPLALVLILFVSIHVLAALYHHFLKRDDILRRMMPDRS